MAHQHQYRKRRVAEQHGGCGARINNNGVVARRHQNDYRRLSRALAAGAVASKQHQQRTAATRCAHSRSLNRVCVRHVCGASGRWLRWNRVRRFCAARAPRSPFRVASAWVGGGAAVMKGRAGCRCISPTRGSAKKRNNISGLTARTAYRARIYAHARSRTAHAHRRYGAVCLLALAVAPPRAANSGISPRGGERQNNGAANVGTRPFCSMRNAISAFLRACAPETKTGSVSVTARALGKPHGGRASKIAPPVTQRRAAGRAVVAA